MFKIKSNSIFSSIITIIFFFPCTNGHATLLDPPSRTSFWRLPEFSYLAQPKNFYDVFQNCGGYKAQALNDGKCGACGDNYDEVTPRKSESGGQFDLGVISRKYQPGSVINTTSLIALNHGGYLEFTLCVRNSKKEAENEECFQKNVLKVEKSAENFYNSRFNVNGIKKGNLSLFVKLPHGVTCSNCVLRMDYIAFEQFRACGDISIN